MVSVDSAAGESIAAPKPCTNRAATSTVSVCASPPASEAPANTSKPVMSMRRRPSRSAGAPAEQQESAVGEDVAVDHPLEALLAEAEIRPDRGQGDVQDRRVEDVHELDEAQQQQDRDASPGRERRFLGRLARVCNSRVGLCTHLLTSSFSPPLGGHIDRFRFVIWLTNYEEAM